MYVAFRPLKLFFFLQCHTNVCIKGVWHRAATTHHTNSSTSEFPLSLPSFSLHKQTIPSAAQDSISRRCCWERPIATAENPVAKLTTTAFCLRHAGARGQPLHHRRVTQPHTRTPDRNISVPHSCVQAGPQTVLILNYTTVQRVRSYAEATARKFSYVLSPLIVQYLKLSWTRVYQRFLNRNKDNKISKSAIF